MKSFKKIFEEKKFYTRTQMIDWCLKNIEDFDITYKTDNENYLDAGVSKQGFKISEDKQVIHRDIPVETVVKTKDTYIPFKFEVLEIITFHAPQLKQFSCNNILLPGSEGDMIGFNKCNSLDFSNVDYIDGMFLYFNNIKKITPQMLNKNEFFEVAFNKCADPHIYDFSNYDNINIESLFVYFDNIPITNLSYIIENDSMEFNEIHFYYKNKFLNMLFKITSKYLQMDNKSEHIMDFTLEMIDAGFEDML